MKKFYNLFYNSINFFPSIIVRLLFYHFNNKDARTIDFEKIFKYVKINKIEGSYLEFGVYRGKSFVLALNTRKKLNIKEMKFFAFDSFTGLHESEGDVFHKFQFANSKKNFMNLLSKLGFTFEDIEIVEGLYSESLKKKINIKAAVVHIDCDLYSSTKDVLEFISPLLSHGSIIIFDDWYSFSNKEDQSNYGEQKAFYEWPLRHKFKDFELIKSKAFIMMS